MLLTELLIAGGALCAGVTAYKKRQKKKKLGDLLQAGTKSKNNNKVMPTSIYGEVKAAIEKFKQENISLFFDDVRNQQLKEILSAADEPNISDAEKRINRCLAVSLISIGATIAGALVYQPLSLLCVPGLIYAGRHFFQDAYKSLFEERRLRVSVVDSIMITGIILTHNYFAGALTVSLLWFSQKLLLKTEDRSQKSLINIFGSQPRKIWILKDGFEVESPFEALKISDIVVVNAGETVLVDGTITDGYASIDQRILTGESQPSEKGIGEIVFASTVVLSGRVCIQVEKAGQETVAAQIGEVLKDTTDFKMIIRSRWLEVVDKTAPVTLAVGASALPFLGPAAAVSLLYSFNYGYSMRVIAPTTMLNFLNLTSKNSILIKDGRAFELLDSVDTLVFDKTGTLTLERPHVEKIYTCNGYQEDELLTYAAAAECKQAHPIAQAILQEAKERTLHLPEIGEAQYEVGYGIKMSVDNQVIRVGSARFMAMEGIAIPTEIRNLQEYCHEHGSSLVMVAVNALLGGAIELHSTIRPEAKRIISRLRSRGMSMYIISGDHEKPTKKLARELGIDHYFAETLPENKADLVEQLQRDGKSVCFVGDGINDSIALKKANVSISLRGAATIATDTAQIILMDESLNQLVYLFDTAKNFSDNMKNSFFITLVPTIIAVGGTLFLGWGITSSVILYYAGLAAGMGNSMLPLMTDERKESGKQAKPQLGLVTQG